MGVAGTFGTGDNTQREKIIAEGGLDENERQIFARLSLKIAAGADPENARDRLASIITKVFAYIRSQDAGID